VSDTGTSAVSAAVDMPYIAGKTGISHIALLSVNLWSYFVDSQEGRDLPK